MKEQLGGIFNEYVLYKKTKLNSDFNQIKTELVNLNNDSQNAIKDSKKQDFNIEEASDTFVNIHNNVLREFEILKYFINRSKQNDIAIND